MLLGGNVKREKNKCFLTITSHFVPAAKQHESYAFPPCTQEHTADESLH